MKDLSLSQISEHMRDIDICMLTTKTKGHQLHARPMSNNRDVDYEGDSHFFTSVTTSLVEDLKADPTVELSFTHHPVLLGKPFYLSVSGKAEIITNRGVMKPHWTASLEAWFPQGLNTPDLAMIKVHASKLKYWYGSHQGELLL